MGTIDKLNPHIDAWDDQHFTVMTPPLLAQRGWQMVMQDTSKIDDMINHVVNNHNRTLDQIVLFVGSEWTDFYAPNKIYRGVQVQPMAAPVCLLVPRINNQGLPYLVKLGNEQYSSVRPH